MDAWETLITGSTIQSGDAWEHLINQGGTGTIDYVVLADGLELEVTSPEFTVLIDEYPVILELENTGFYIEVEKESL